MVFYPTQSKSQTLKWATWLCVIWPQFTFLMSSSVTPLSFSLHSRHSDILVRSLPSCPMADSLPSCRSLLKSYPLRGVSPIPVPFSTKEQTPLAITSCPHSVLFFSAECFTNYHAKTLLIKQFIFILTPSEYKLHEGLGFVVWSLFI